MDRRTDGRTNEREIYRQTDRYRERRRTREREGEREREREGERERVGGGRERDKFLGLPGIRELIFGNKFLVSKFGILT